MMRKYSVIKGPIITEKASGEMERNNKYSFEVDRKSGKIEIKRAIEEAFKVSVIKINTISMRGKMKRVRWQLGKTPDWKKAIITLKDGDKIDYT